MRYLVKHAKREKKRGGKSFAWQQWASEQLRHLCTNNRVNLQDMAAIFLQLIGARQVIAVYTSIQIKEQLLNKNTFRQLAGIRDFYNLVQIPVRDNAIFPATV